MEIFDAGSYKEAIQIRLDELKKRGRKISVRKLSETIQVQYTYLSKVLNHEKSHLNEDQLWAIAHELECHESETEFLLLLRSREISQNPKRRKVYDQRIASIQKARQLKAKSSDLERYQLDREMDYLFRPECLLLYISLHVEEYRKNLSKLRFVMGMDEKVFRENLMRLVDLGMITLDDRKLSVQKLQKAHTHYGLKHPLMRVHQSLMRALSLSKIPQTEEAHKNNFMVSFASDAESFNRIQDELKNFLQKVEKIVLSSKPEATYQLNLDLFRWW